MDSLKVETVASFIGPECKRTWSETHRTQVQQTWWGALQTGLKWTVLSHELFNIPRVADLVQAGVNSANHTTLAETELQLCRKILEKVVQRTKD